MLRLSGGDPARMMTGENHALAPPQAGEGGRDLAEAPPEVRLDMPDWLLPRLEAALGAETEAACLSLAARAPVTLRVNLRKAPREEAQRALSAEGIETTPDPEVGTALHVTAAAGKIAGSAAYGSGLVELQDASSQAAVLRLPLCDGDRILDFCAGGGGKTLAMGGLAYLRLHAYDADPRRMADLPPRAVRAGIEVRTLTNPAKEAPFDLVLADAPCSGSGTWRRAPEAKWRLMPDRLRDLVALQDRILDEAADLVRPGGHLAFATCSILLEEGPERVEAFRTRHPGWVTVDEFRRTPGASGDGFFQGVLCRNGGAS
jgi:16S rRNA (cytosine967-C5)-methyltransferase